MKTLPHVEPALLAEVRDAVLTVDEVLAAVRHDAAGAIAIFVGQVRNHDDGKGVTALSYSCHPTATQAAVDVATSLAHAHPQCRLAVLHRVGELSVGDIAIVAAVSAAHRDDAFSVCRALVDAVKAEVPIWKHQTFADGSDEWVGLG
ncbi:MAG: molybdenum cofactor biosynthesis protein MoaE [Dermatophilaceae bacterium]